MGWFGVGLGGQSGCERRIEIFLKIQKKNLGGGGWGRGQGGCERRNEVFVKIQKKKYFLGGVGGRGRVGGGGGGSGWM